MRIANPIYDVVFRYLMEDREAAVLFLEAVTGLRIHSLEVEAQTQTKDSEESKKDKAEKLSLEERLSLTVYSLDFKAVVSVNGGEKRVVILELQKSMLSGDIMRFRNYLGKQYADPKLSYEARTREGRFFKAGIPIISIYILGSPLPKHRDIPVLDIKRKVIDRHSGEELSETDEFIEGLYHEGIIISASDLKGKKRDELEKLLSIFDQEFADPETGYHTLNLNEAEFPERYKKVFRRLLKAAKDRKLRREMDKQDRALAEYEEIEKRLSATQKHLDAEKEAHELTRREAAEEKIKAALAAEREEKAKKNEEEARKNEEEAKRQAENLRFSVLQNPSINDELAASLLNISIEEVRKFREG